MKTKSALFALMTGWVAFILLLNGLLFYSTKCSDEYLQTVNVWGEKSSIKLADFKRQQQIMASLPQDPAAALTRIRDSLNYLNPYQYLTKEEQQKRTDTLIQYGLKEHDYENYLRLYRCYSNVVNYSEYISGVLQNTRNIASVLSPLQKDNWVLQNVMRCEKDYYGLEYLNLAPALDDSVNLVLQYHITDFLAFLMLVFLVLQLFWYFQKHSLTCSGAGSFPMLTTLLLGLSGTLLLYLTNLILIGHSAGLPSLSVPLQSLESFYSCEYAISLGTFLALWLILKLAALLFLTAICVLVLTGKHPLGRLLPFTGVLLLEYRLTFLSEQQVALIPLREINLFSGFTFERFFTRYLNLNIRGHLFPRLPLFLVAFTIPFLIIGFLALRGCRHFLAQNILLLQQDYFREIEDHYQETRRLWHDFHNHLLAVKALYSSGNAEEAEKYIDDLAAFGNYHLLPAKTGSNAVDLLLFQKYQRALDMGYSIRFTIGCCLTRHHLKDYDLCSLLGNLLDNAMESCQSLSSVDPLICLRMEEMGSMLFISCRNPFEGERTEAGGHFPTTKKNKAGHGLGLQSVRQICRKYKGSLEIDTADHLFLIKILLNDSTG